MRAKTDGSDLEKVRRVIAILADKRGALGDVALSFGDVLGVGASRKRSAADALKDVLLLLALLIPAGRKRAEAPSSVSALDFLLVSARHDERSRARIGQLESELRGAGGRTWIAGDTANAPTPGWGPWTVATRLHCDWSELTRIVTAVFAASRQVNLPRAEAVWLARWLALQAVRTTQAERVLRSLDPRIVITDFDRGLDGGPYAAAARRCAIPSVTLVHGDPNEIAYAPPLADVMLFWSCAQQRAYQSWLDRPVAGAVVGAFWQTDLQVGTVERQNHLLLVHTGAESVTEFFERTSDLVQGMIERGWHVRLRPHPMAKLDQRARVMLRQKGLQQSSGTLRDDLQWASTVVCGHSTVALDAAAAGRRVVVQSGPPGPFRLASMASCTTETAEDLPGEWAVLVPPARAEGWPYAAVGAAALRRTSGILMDLLQTHCEQKAPQHT
jgi:hypothetical protein